MVWGVRLVIAISGVLDQPDNLLSLNYFLLFPSSPHTNGTPLSLPLPDTTHTYTGHLYLHGGQQQDARLTPRPRSLRGPLYAAALPHPPSSRPPHIKPWPARGSGRSSGSSRGSCCWHLSRFGRRGGLWGLNVRPCLPCLPKLKLLLKKFTNRGQLLFR